MKQLILDPPTLGFVVGTRVALAVGVGLLLADRLSDNRRRTIGAALVGIGAVTTIPAAMSLARGFRRARRRSMAPGLDRDERLIGAERFPRKGDDH